MIVYLDIYINTLSINIEIISMFIGGNNMTLFDCILESSQFIHEGLLSSANMKSQLITVLLKIYNGKTDMDDAKDIESAIKKKFAVYQK